MMADTKWATPLVVSHSGVEGPRVMVLGGVHGNEPGGWRAAEQIAQWQPTAGSLLTIPRANVLATYEFERTLPGFGDLNRLYPGRSTLLPMMVMASEIVAVAREFEVDVLLDLHESWGFFAERFENGTAFLGQTVTRGAGPLELAEVTAIVDATNEQTTSREQLELRERGVFTRPPNSPANFEDDDEPEQASVTQAETMTAFRGSGSSSLSIGSYVPGLTPILIEMGQDRQPEWRRSELHQLFVRTTLERWGMI